MEARASAKSRYSLRRTSSYFSVWMNDSHAALSSGFPFRDMLTQNPKTVPVETGNIHGKEASAKV